MNDPWRGSIETTDGTTTVHNESGSVWGGPAVLSEETSIGVEQGTDPYMLGRVSDLTVGNDLIYVIDAQVPAVRTYSLDGEYRGDLGAGGQGPGEYTSPSSIRVDPTGRIYVRDIGNGRINLYTADGTPVATYPISSRFTTSEPMVVTADGTVFTQVITGRDGNGELRIGYRAHDQTGPVGTPVGPENPPPAGPWLTAESGDSMSRQNIPFAPGFTWTLAPSRAVISGRAHEYRFEVRSREGHITTISRAWTPVHVEVGEREWRRDTITLQMRETQPDWSWDGPPIPEHKAAYSYFIPAVSGETWVVRSGPSSRVADCAADTEDLQERYLRPCWTSANVIDAFGPDGRFLGEVELPDGFRLYPRPHIDGDTVTAVVEDDLGTIRVKRFRIVTRALE